MARYLVLSTAIVLAIAVVVAGWANRDLLRIKIASVYAHTRGRPGAFAGFERATTPPLRGNAPWALSALPECLTQTSISQGSLAYVRAHLPAGAVRIVPPASLVYGDCSIRITGDEAYVRRGSDRLRIPPRAEFYRAGNSLALVLQMPDGNELRVYRPATQ